MPALLVPIAALLLSDALLLLAHGLMLTLLPIVGQAGGFTDTQVAFTGSAYFLGFVSGCLATPYIVRRVGHIRSFAVLASLYSAIVLFFPWLPQFIAWLLLRFLVGAAISGLYMIIESWLNERSSRETRGTILSIYTVINLGMMTLGQQLMNLGGVDAPLLFALAAVLFSLAIVPVSLTLALAPAPLQKVSIDLRGIWRHSQIALVGAVITGLVTGAFWSLGPVYARSQGLDTLELTWFMSLTVLGGAAFQVPLGRLSDRVERRIVLLVAALAGVLFSTVLVALPMLLSANLALGLLPAAFFWGGAVMTQYAICLAHANDNAPPEDFVTVGSGMLLVTGLFSAVGAPLASLSMTLLGPVGMHVFSAACLLVFAVVITIRRSTHKLPEPEYAEPFRVVTNTTTPAVLEMDPRTDAQAPQEEPGENAAHAPGTLTAVRYPKAHS